MGKGVGIGRVCLWAEGEELGEGAELSLFPLSHTPFSPQAEWEGHHVGGAWLGRVPWREVGLGAGLT